MTNPALVTLCTAKGDLTISKIANGIAYDQFNNQIPSDYFRFNRTILRQEWVKPDDEIVENIEVNKLVIV